MVAQQGIALVERAAEDRIILALGKGRLQADRDRFLTDIQVAETADQAETVQLARTLFEPGVLL